ncbi:Response regulator receiver domain-containing protein [Desulfocicer vacuolatum DSM 3385]|uniref:Response regulator receiver domain-containing protein n=1 Tax=Desulfocicer vacuolatum DSM 3385 TaxID=1121400 RepID=A0A1W2E0P2_9BACT|nr:response regulator [Desulfocicer vacuolatum]SMD02608.1 Response regulator receiver domain-containing protein [Desulfocicer vacuolatum DSM 3385]
MEIICTGCSAKLNIPDHKIPKDRKASFLCPKCKQRLYVGQDAPGTGETPKPTAPTAAAEAPAQSNTPDYDASERPFDYLDDDAETALICLGESDIQGHARNALEKMGYHIEAVKDVRTALTRMKYHLFNIIVLDEQFDTEHRGTGTLFQELKDLDMGLRRQIVVILISNTVRTQDNMAALHTSVNQIINRKDMPANALNLFKKTLKDHGQFYAIFNETLKKMGKI